jgi:hypothetical protein
MELSPFWEAYSCTGTQELPNILWNPKVHYSFHSSPPLVTTLSQISPVHTTLSLRLSLMLSFYLSLGLPSGLFPSGFPTNILHAFIFNSRELHALPISSPLTWSFWLYLANSTSYEAPHYAVFSNLSSLHLSPVQTLPSAPCSRTIYVPSLMSENKFHTHTEPQAKLHFCIL